VSVGAEWSKDHVSAIDTYALTLLEFNGGKNGDRAWPFRGISGTLEKETGRESVVAIPRFLCGSPRLCRLSTEGFVPVSKY
jgi:hypothetical protein